MQNLYRRFFVVTGFLSICFFSQAQDSTKQKKERPEDKIEQYFFVLLKTGTKQDFDSAQKAELFKGHMANINRLYYDGIIKVAGPFGKNDLEWRGIFVFDCKTKEEAEKIAQTDPAVAAGLFTADISAWYSSPIGSFKHGKPEKPL
jgi:uncharacterized protein YciI